MDFAKKYMKKHGWQEGKGLGKKEDGINVRLRLKTQKDAVGLGYDRTKGINCHTWFAQLDEEICKAQERRKRKNEDDEEVQEESAGISGLFSQSVTYQGRFVKGTSDDSLSGKEKKKRKKSKVVIQYEKEGKEEKEEASDFKRTSLDLEQLYKKTKGATCHRTAHVGLKLSGKLQRLEEQERNFNCPTSSKS